MPPQTRNNGSKSSKGIHVSQKEVDSQVFEAKTTRKKKKCVPRGLKKNSEKEAHSQVVDESSTPKISKFFKATGDSKTSKDSEKEAHLKLVDESSTPQTSKFFKVAGDSKTSKDLENESHPQVSEESTARISKFFKPVNKPVCKKNTQTNVKNGSDSRQYYVETLKKTLASYPESHECDDQFEFTLEHGSGSTHQECEEDFGAISSQNDQENELNCDNQNSDNVNNTKITCSGCLRKTQELMVSEMKYKEVHKRYTKLSVYCSELQLKYDDLLKTGTRTVQLDTMDEPVSSDDIFSSAEIKMLQGIHLEKKKDSTFIVQCLRFAYQDDASILKFRTAVKGKPASIEVDEEIRSFMEGKSALTPEKVSRIRQLFSERLTKCKIGPVEYGDRIKDVNQNRLLNSRIKNIARQC